MHVLNHVKRLKVEDLVNIAAENCYQQNSMNDIKL